MTTKKTRPLGEVTEQGADAFRKQIQEIINVIKEQSKSIPEKQQALRKDISNALASLSEVDSRIDDKFSKVEQDLKGKMDSALANSKPTVVSGSSGDTLSLRHESHGPKKDFRLSNPRKTSNQKIRPIYPVRYAYVNFFGDALLAPSDPPALKVMLNQESTLTKDCNGYAARILRPGWVYIKEEGGYSDFHIFKYEHVDVNGQIRERFTKYLFNNGINAQGGIHADNSGAFGEKGYPFVFVRERVSTVSIAYSEHEWHPNVIDTMNGSSQVRNKAMQKVNLLAADRCTVTATENHFKALVEDYRDTKDRLLGKRYNPNNPEGDILKGNLDALLSEQSYQLDADIIANDLQQFCPAGETANIVALYDPVGRQRDIAEVHGKLLIWSKNYQAQNQYPAKIGSYLDSLKEIPDSEDLQDILEERINWAEYNTWKSKYQEEENLYKERLQQFTDLFKGFMQDAVLLDQPGALDTYFKDFFGTGLDTTEGLNQEMTKLCDVVAGIFSGIAGSTVGAEMLEHLHDQSASGHSVYNSLLKVFNQLFTHPQALANWDDLATQGMNKVLLNLGQFWGRINAEFSTMGHNAAELRYQAHVQLCQNVIPYIQKMAGIQVVNGETITLTSEQLAKTLARYLDEGVQHYPGANPGKTLDKALAKVEAHQKLFDWAQRGMKNAAKRKWIFPKIIASQKAIEKLKLLHFEKGTKVLGLSTGGALAGWSALCNIETITHLSAQSRYDKAAPLGEQSQFHDGLRFSAAICGLTFDIFAIGTNLAKVSELMLPGAETVAAEAAALAPKLATHFATKMTAVMGSAAMSGILAIANLATAIDAFWNMTISIKQDNYGEATGHALIGVGASMMFFTLAAKVATAGTTTGAATGGISTVAAIALAAILVGAGLVCYFKKSDFELLLENCFWGSGNKYLFWSDEEDRPYINDRLRESRKINVEPYIYSSFLCENQEFLNNFFTPQLES